MKQLVLLLALVLMMPAAASAQDEYAKERLKDLEISLN
jgi:hypothetical protein